MEHRPSRSARTSPASIRTSWWPRYGSPLYVYDADVLRRRAAALRAALPETRRRSPSRPRPTPRPRCSRTWREPGWVPTSPRAASCARSLEPGSQPERRRLHRPRQDRCGARGRARGRRRGADHRVARRARRGHRAWPAGPAPGQGLMLRLATGGEAEDTPIIGAAGSDKFGLTDDEADEAVGDSRAAGALAPDGPFRLRGFHAFGASNVLGRRGCSWPALADLARAGRAHRCAATASSSSCSTPAAAWASPTPTAKPPLDIAALGEGVEAEMATWAGRPPLRNARLLFEPGRWLAGPAGAYLCRVTRTKVARRSPSIAITDGGIHHLLRPRLVGQDHRVVRCRRHGRAPGGRTRRHRRPAVHRHRHPRLGASRRPHRAPAICTPSSMRVPTATASRCPCSCRTPCPPRCWSTMAEVSVSRRPDRARLSGAAGSVGDAQPHGCGASSAWTRWGAVPPMTSGRASAFSSARPCAARAADSGSDAAAAGDGIGRCREHLGDVDVGQLGQLHPGRLGARDQRAHDVVALTEGHAQLDERVGHRGRGGVARRQPPRACAPRRRAAWPPCRP